jgi:hypothetical protein
MSSLEIWAQAFYAYIFVAIFAYGYWKRGHEIKDLRKDIESWELLHAMTKEAMSRQVAKLNEKIRELRAEEKDRDQLPQMTR